VYDERTGSVLAGDQGDFCSACHVGGRYQLVVILWLDKADWPFWRIGRRDEFAKRVRRGVSVLEVRGWIASLRSQ
jgi:hypothetical protein